MSSAADLSAVRVVFASGIAELNQAMLAHFAAVRSELPLYVVAEFRPEAGEWIQWHIQRTFGQNLAYVKAALAGKRIDAAAAAFDSRSALGDLRRAAQVLVPEVLTAYDEEMRTAVVDGGFFWRRRIRETVGYLRTGGRAHAWLRRVVHPSEAEIPIRARLAQAKGLATSRRRAAHATPLAQTGGTGTMAGVSVVIPSRDGLELLREMLPPLLPQLKRGEVIVVDNGSTDNTAEWLAREYAEIRVIRHAEPLSFARAVNQGIRQAHYARTLLLNNDMIAEAGFIAALDAAFMRVPDLFCATAQIFFPNGIRREETGKTVWRTEGELDFPVRCDDPQSGEDLTWVLYGSGGCSLFDTAKLVALGGVSELYDPAYVEDLDFGFRAWKYGWPSVYCAGARVEHRHRSTTSRFYTTRQIDFFVERNYLRFVATAVANRELFERLWLAGIRRMQLQAMQGRDAALDTLRAVPSVSATVMPASGHLTEPEILALSNGDIAVFPGVLSQREHSGGITVLIASPYLPYPLSHGGAVRIYNLMKLAAETDNLILVAFADELAAPPGELLAICAQIVLVRRHGSHYKRDTARPDVVEEFDSDSFRACLKQAVHQWRPDIVQLEFTWMAQYADACNPARTILVEHDITFDLQQQLLATSPGSGPARMELEQQLQKWQAFETAAWKGVDCVVTMSAKDAEIVSARSVVCLPNGVDCDRFQPVAAEGDERRLLLIGSFAHLPNLLALEFFVNEVWPKLSPGYRLHIIGGARHDYYLDYFRDRISVDVRQPGIEVEGFVSDVRSAYNRAAIVLAPLTASAGTNIKVLEAIAMGKAIVSTRAGVNGIDITPNHDFLLAESAAQMAEQIDALATDTALRKSIERNAREAALLYDWRAIGDRQGALYRSLRAGHPDIQ